VQVCDSFACGINCGGQLRDDGLLVDSKGQLMNVRARNLTCRPLACLLWVHLE
jgi:hypothetical protein